MGVEVSQQAIVVGGARVATAQAGIRYARPDMALIELAADSVTAAVLTRNHFVAAPIEVARRHLDARASRYLLVNAGCANVGLGEAGVRDALACCEAVGRATDVPIEAVLPFSTGTIGGPLPVEKMTACIPELVRGLSDDGWPNAAEAIMTTDTRPKLASVELQSEHGACRILGIAKGSGMIAPNMATMLGFVVTDAALSSECASRLLRAATERTFNCIAVDGDTSTNDACTLSATGRSGVTLEQLGEERFYEALLAVMDSLAHAIVDDGEGATHVVTIRVEGAADEASAKEVARTVALSPLVKTAVYGNDPNWGRIIAAIGRAPVAFDFRAMRCWIGEQLVFADGQVAPDYDEARAAECMRAREWELRIALGEGASSAVFRTCDFSTEYVTINASYRS